MLRTEQNARTFRRPLVLGSRWPSRPAGRADDDFALRNIARITGWGECYIRAAVAHDICARVAYRGDALAVAADAAVNGEVVKLGGDGGAIALDREGNIAMPFNTSGMYRAWIKPDGSRGTAVFRDP